MTDTPKLPPFPEKLGGRGADSAGPWELYYRDLTAAWEQRCRLLYAAMRCIAGEVQYWDDLAGNVDIATASLKRCGRLPGEESDPAVTGGIASAPSQEGAVPAAAGSDAVRVLEALEKEAKRILIFNRSAVGLPHEYACSVDTHRIILAALAAVKAQEGTGK